MKKLGHTRVDILKVDVQGMEYEIFDAIDSAGFPDVGEVLIEMHWKGHIAANRFFEMMFSNRYRVFHHEPNMWFKVQCSAGMEYAFVKVDK